jgi:serine/threonine-protein kinase
MNLGERIAALFRLFLLFAVLVAVGLISAITTIRLAIHGRQATMPNLVGMQLETAERIAESRGLELKVEDKLFSTQYAANEIVSQMPPAGTGLKEGQHVHVLVSLGAPRVPVPNLVGDSLRVARIKATERGLNVGDVVAVHWAGGLEDRVLVQDPAPSTVEVHSPALNLLVSLGQPPGAFLCPSFIGRPLAEARRALEKAGFKVGAITPIPTDTTPKGTILTQSPPPGSKIDLDTAFAFQVAD